MNWFENPHNLADIIRESAKSPLGVFSLMLILLFLLSFSFFNEASETVRLAVYISLLVGITLFGVVISFTTLQQKIDPNNLRNKEKSKAEEENSVEESEILKTKEELPIEEEGSEKLIIDKKNISDFGTPNIYKWGISFLILLIGCLAFWDLTSRHHYTYYKNYKKVDGIWYGLGPVSSSDINKMNSYYRFERRGRVGNIITVRKMNGSGWYPENGIESILGDNSPPCSHNRAVIVKFKYDENNNLIHQSAYDQAERLIVTMRYTSNPFIARFEYANGSSCPRSPSGADVVKFVRYNSGPNIGMDQEIHFLKGNSIEPQPTPDLHGNFGYKYVYNDEGYPTKVTELDYNWEPYGRMKTFTYDVRGNRTSISNKNADGSPRLNDDSVYRIKLKYDEYGNIISRSYHGLNDELANNKFAYAIYNSVYDKFGNEVEETFFSSDSLATNAFFDEDDGGYHKVKSEFNDRGLRTHYGIFDSQDNMTTSTSGFSFIKYKWDEAGGLIYRATYDENGKLTNENSGYAIRIQEFNNDGFLVSRSYFNTREEPTTREDGIHKRTNEYDKANNRISDKYFDTELRPVRDKNNIHFVMVKFDNYNNPIEFSNFDEFNNKTIHKEGFHKLEYSYNDYGKRSSSKTFDLNGDPLINANGFFEIKNEYNKAGQLISISYFGIDGEPTEWQDGYHKVIYDRDHQNYIIEENYYDTHGNLVKNKNGFASAKYINDNYGNTLQLNLFDENGLTATYQGRHSGISRKYNEFGTLTEQKLTDENGNLIKHQDGHLILKYHYDEKNQLVKREHLDANGNLMLDNEGIAYTVYENDEKGFQIERRRYNKNGDPRSSKSYPHRVVYINDHYGRTIEERFYDESLNPTYNEDMAEIIKYDYDNWGREISRSYMDQYHNLIVGSGGYAALEQQYNTSGHRVKRLFRGADKKLIKNSSGISIIEEKVNAIGNIVEKRYYDEAGNPINGNEKAPFHLTEYEYNDFHQEVDRKHYLVSGDMVEIEDE